MMFVLYCTEQEREVQKNYWSEHSADLSLEAMMLDSKASDLDKEDRPEVYFLKNNKSCMWSLYFSFIYLNKSAIILIYIYIYIYC